MTFSFLVPVSLVDLALLGVVTKMSTHHQSHYLQDVANDWRQQDEELMNFFSFLVCYLLPAVGVEGMMPSSRYHL